MKMLQTLKLAGFGVLLPATMAYAQVVLPTPQLALPATFDASLAKSGQAAIRGVAVDAKATPVANAKVQLRNLGTRNVEHVGAASPRGEFNFVVRPEMPYVVEVVDLGGRVIAVGDVIIAHAGDVAAATIALPARLAGLTGLAAQSAGSAASAASGVSVAAAQATALPFVSPEK
jgi:hypothetical protein